MIFEFNNYATEKISFERFKEEIIKLISES